VATLVVRKEKPAGHRQTMGRGRLKEEAKLTLSLTLIDVVRVDDYYPQTTKLEPLWWGVTIFRQG
jgi:hypothetical protein